MDGVDVENKLVATQTLTINLPDGKKVMSPHMCDIQIPGLLTVLVGHIVLSLSIESLIGICPLCKTGCKVVFDNNKFDLGWEIHSEFHGIPQLIRFRTF
jgi:hypothetical protein